MTIPSGLLFTKEHEWVRIDGQTATMGISDFAQEQLGDITYVELPAAGKVVKQHDALAVVESVKAASDVYAPLSGTVAVVNDTLNEHPEQINSAPYGNGWLCTLSGISAAEAKALMTAEQYAAFVKEGH